MLRNRAEMKNVVSWLAKRERELKNVGVYVDEDVWTGAMNDSGRPRFTPAVPFSTSSSAYREPEANDGLVRVDFDLWLDCERTEAS